MDKREEWIARVKVESPTCYTEVIRQANRPDLIVSIYPSDELMGLMHWVIDAGDSFWLDALPTREEAIKLCHEMGWKIGDAK